jgi:hypothetical protein
LAKESEWRLNAVALGLDPLLVSLAAPLVGLPGVYLCNYLPNPLQAAIYTQPAADMPLAAGFFGFTHPPSHFPYGLPVTPD